MAEQTVEQRLDLITKSMSDLAGVVRDLAYREYHKNDVEDYGDEEEYEDPIEMRRMRKEEHEEPDGDEMPPIEMSRMRKEHPGDEDVEEDTIELEDDGALEDVMPGEGDLEMGDEEDEDLYPTGDLEMMRKEAIAKRKAYNKRRVAKGFSNVAQRTANEEDSPFGEQQDDLAGNAASPAGEQGGGREDETFNAKFARDILKSLRPMIRKEVAAATGRKVTKARAITPPMGAIRKGREQSNEGVVTRDVEEQVKSRSFREINQLREQMGDLPKNGITS